MIRTAVVLGLILTLAVGGASTARTANASLSAVPRVTTASSTINAARLAPATCTNRAGLTAVLVAAATGNVAGTGSNELVLGRPHTANYTLGGGGGADCLIGGLGTGGSETLNGGAGTDICIGNNGTQTFTGCETQIAGNP